MRQVSTAIAVYHQDIQPSLHGRQLFVRQELDAFIQQYDQAPTALELLRFVASRHLERHFDPNSVRPRLTEMWEQGWVAHGSKRECSISGKTVFTWVLSKPRAPTLTEPEPQRLRF